MPSSEIRVLAPFSEKAVAHLLTFLQCQWVFRFFVGEFPNFWRLQPSTRPLEQKQWLKEKYKLFQSHHNHKTLGQFFPALYEEFFSRWPVTPTAKAIEATEGNAASAAANLRKVGERVRDVYLPAWMIFMLIKLMIRQSTAGCSTIYGRSMELVGRVHQPA